MPENDATANRIGLEVRLYEIRRKAALFLGNKLLNIADPFYVRALDRGLADVRMFDDSGRYTPLRAISDIASVAPSFARAAVMGLALSPDPVERALAVDACESIGWLMEDSPEFCAEVVSLLSSTDGTG